MSMEKVLVIGTRDARRRYRFVYEPLLSVVGEEAVSVFECNAPPPVYAARAAWFAFRHAYDQVVYCGGSLSGLYWWFLARFFLGAKVVGRFGSDIVLLKRVMYEQSETLWGKLLTWIDFKSTSRFVALVDRAVVVNADIVEGVERSVGPGVPVSVVPQPCLVRARPSRHAVSNETVLLTVANYAYRNKADGTIWMMEQLVDIARRSIGNYSFHVAGGGSNLGRVRRFAAQINEQEVGVRVIVHGFVNDIDRLYATADVFIYHSTLDALPNVLLEAQAHGLPVVVNDFPAFRDVIADGETGLFFASGDAGSFSDVLGSVLEDEVLRDALAVNALENIRKNYSFEAIGKRWSEILGGITLQERHVVRFRE